MNDLTGPTFMGEPVLPKPAKHCDRGPDDCVQCSVLAGTFAVKSAAPSAPEGGHIDRARFEKAPCYLCGYNGPGYYQPGTHSCAAKYHATQPEE